MSSQSPSNEVAVGATDEKSLVMENTTAVPRFHDAQVNRSIIHPLLPQPPLIHADDDNATVDKERHDTTFQFVKPVSMSHTFVVVADTQFGMINENRDWDIEMQYSRQAVQQINALRPRPLYCCICGDLVDMSSSIYNGKPKRLLPSSTSKTDSVTTTSSPPTTTATRDKHADNDDDDVWTEVECDVIQEQQNIAMKEIWYNLHPDIALICLCGNHDVGNRPTPATIQKYTSIFGDDYLSFWVNGTFNIVINSTLFSDPTSAISLYKEQLCWMEQQLLYANKYSPRNIFVFSHHPWFLYKEDEDVDDYTGLSYLIPGNTDLYVPDSYFPIPKEYRDKGMSLFRQHHVSACFAGHFHQNLISQTSFGMEMIITGSLSMVLQSTGNPNLRGEPETQGFRVVTVDHNPAGGKSSYSHKFVSIGNETDIAN